MEKPAEDSQLSEKEYNVLREKGTERPFTSDLLEEKREGVYYCKGCGAELFSSKSKFDSGTGWPSFDSFMNEDSVELGESEQGGYEVHCKKCGGHLGHVFEDGPKTTGKRFCINGCVLDFKSNE